METEFFQDHVRHTRYVERGGNVHNIVKDDWSNCGELGTGGFGVVNQCSQRARPMVGRPIGRRPG